MNIDRSNFTAPQAPQAASPAIQKYQAAKSVEKSAEKSPAKPVAIKRDQVEVSGEARAKLAAEQTASKERKADQQDAKQPQRA